MARVNVHVPDQMLQIIDGAAKRAKLGRSAWLQQAVERYVTLETKLEQMTEAMARVIRILASAASIDTRRQRGTRVVAVTPQPGPRRGRPRKDARRPKREGK